MPNFSDIEKRYKWAKTRRADLERSVNLYKKRHPLLFRASIAEDRMSWKLEASIDKPPPLIEWGLWHAGIVHDLRSVLDNLVWMICHASQVPSNPNKLEFPIVMEASDWNGRARSKIAELPDAYKRCIESLQPFNRPQTDSVGVTLRFIHQLDIQNKHHAPVVTGVSDVQEIQNSRRIIYREEPDSSETTSVRLFPFQYQDGLVVWHETVPKPIDRVEGGGFRLTAHFVIQDENNVKHPLLGSLDYALKGCWEVFEILKAVQDESN